MRRKCRCKWCRKDFLPSPYVGNRQVCCNNPDCKKKQKSSCHKRWKKNNQEDYRKGQQDWRKEHPHYWKNYRKSHPKYTVRNRRQSKIRKALSVAKTGLQKRISSLQVAEKQMEFWSLPRFAKQSQSLIPLLYAITQNQNLNRGGYYGSKQRTTRASF